MIFVSFRSYCDIRVSVVLRRSVVVVVTDVSTICAEVISNDNRPPQCYTNLDNITTRCTVTPRFKPFTVLYVIFVL